MPRINKPKSSLIRIAQFLFLVNTIIWLTFSFISFGKIEQFQDNQISLQWIIPILMFGNAGAMLFSALSLFIRKKWLFIIVLTILTINILLTFTDQVGFFDWLTLLIDIIILLLLVAVRKEYFSH